jgi:hypothetical protein
MRDELDLTRSQPRHIFKRIVHRSAWKRRSRKFATASNTQATIRICYLRDEPMRVSCHAWRQGKVRAIKRGCVVAKAGDVIENPVTEERAVVRLGNEDTGEDRLVGDLYVKPGGAVAGEHVHPVTEESFTVVRGQVGFRIDGRR